MAGKAWVFGDDINTDLLAPGRTMKFGVAEIARHCMASVAPEFAAQVARGDVIVAGRNFGAGSSREQAVEVLVHLGIVGVVARSFSGLYYRNGFNLGLPLLVCPQADLIVQGESVSLDVDAALLHRASGQLPLACEAVPPHLLTLVHDGGLVPHLAKRLAVQRTPQEQV